LPREIGSQPGGHIDAAEQADRRVIELLGGMGSDTGKMHDIDFFFYLPTEEGAYRIAARLQKDGFDVEVHPPDESSEWSCCATKTMVPEFDAIVKIREYLTALAELHGGKFDGWGTPLDL
jgi:regulator of RNase E activity RraB